MSRPAPVPPPLPADPQPVLLDGGSRLEVNGEPRATEGASEYAALYRDFIDLIDERRSHVDTRPLRLCADAFLLGRRTIVVPFDD